MLWICAHRHLRHGRARPTHQKPRTLRCCSLTNMPLSGVKRRERKPKLVFTASRTVAALMISTANERRGLEHDLAEEIEAEGPEERV